MPEVNDGEPDVAAGKISKNPFIAVCTKGRAWQNVLSVNYTPEADSDFYKIN